VILVDANILMYAAGREHPHRDPSLSFLEDVAEGRVDAALDAEVLQEVLHRYRVIGRWADGRRVFDGARRIFAVVLPVSVEVLDRARTLLDEHSGLSARDAVHASVVETYRLEAICSFDSHFDRVQSIRRVEPGDLSSS